jgi:predicted nucleic-acid-binding Zn-ribbon protein
MFGIFKRKKDNMTYTIKELPSEKDVEIKTKPYAPDARCIKCRKAEIETKYISPLFNFYCGNKCPKKEHLHRTCSNCGYVWVESCLDDRTIQE